VAGISVGVDHLDLAAADAVGSTWPTLVPRSPSTRPTTPSGSSSPCFARWRLPMRTSAVEGGRPTGISLSLARLARGKVWQSLWHKFILYRFDLLFAKFSVKLAKTSNIHLIIHPPIRKMWEIYLNSNISIHTKECLCTFEFR
jgi:hypothetical protein